MKTTKTNKTQNAQEKEQLEYIDFRNLTPALGSNKPKTRVGRGHAAGKGKQAGRGQSGQKKRSTVRIGFEGGQNPFYRRIPKRGFNSVDPQKFEIVSLETLAKHFSPQEEITPEALKSKKITNKNFAPKILANGQLEKPLSIKGIKISKTAREIIEKLGGRVE